MMDEINDIFASLVEGLEASDSNSVRYIARIDDGFTVTLPVSARDTIAELAVLAGFAAKSSDAPVLYQDGDDQAAYDLIASSAITSAALHDCDIVKASIFADIVSAQELHAWLRVMNHIRALLTSGVKSPQDMAVLRASSSDTANLLDFVGAVQHEVLEALM